MFASFLLTLREGLEAALIVSIVLGVLLKLKRPDFNARVWLGVGLGVALSAVVAVALNLLGLEFEGRGEQLFEGTAMLLASGVLTWMIIWMRNHGASLKSEIEVRTSQAALKKGQNALMMLSFLAVFREGIELALYLLAAGLASSPTQTLVGALLGLAAAVAFGWVLFTSARRLNLRRFFNITNVMLIIFAAGMVGLGVHEFNEAGLIPAVIEHVWDLNPILSADSQVGLVLKALVGYNSTPSLTSVIGYLAYLVGILFYSFAHKGVRILKPELSRQ